MTARVKQVLGGLLFTISAGITITIAALGSGKHPPDETHNALLIAGAIVAQGASVWLFSGRGRAEPTLARRATERLVTLAQSTAETRHTVEASLRARDGAAALRETLGKVSVALSYLEEGFIDALKDWQAFHPDAAAVAVGKNRDGDGADDKA